MGVQPGHRLAVGRIDDDRANLCALAEMLRGGRALLRRPRRAVSQLKEGLASIGATTLAGINAPAPPSPFNVEIGPHRRYTYLDADLDSLKSGVELQVKEHPGLTLLIAVGLGYLLGKALRK